MQEHLTDEQLAGQLVGSADARTREHLVVCAACRNERERLVNLLARYQEAIRVAASRPEAFWQWQRTALAAQRTVGTGSRRLAWAAAAALVLMAMLLTEKTPPANSLPQSDPDQVLLVDIERSVRREVPRALEPAALLAQEVSRSAEARSRGTHRKIGKGEWE